MLGPKDVQVSGRCRERHDEEFCGLLSSVNDTRACFLKLCGTCISTGMQLIGCRLAYWLALAWKPLCRSTRQPTAQTELPNTILILNKNRKTRTTKRKLQKLEHNLPTISAIDSGKK